MSPALKAIAFIYGSILLLSALTEMGKGAIFFIVLVAVAFIAMRVSDNIREKKSQEEKTVT